MAGTVTASIVKNDTTSPPAFQNSAGNEIGQLCRAWVSFNGTTGAIRGTAFNISAVTRNTTGDYTITFSTALSSVLPDANYVVVSTCNKRSSTRTTLLQTHETTAPTTSTIALRLTDTADASFQDMAYCYVAIFR